MNFLHFGKAALEALTGPPLLLIYQMGKVGSQSIEATLRSLKLPYEIYRPHFVSPARQQQFRGRLEFQTMSVAAKASLQQQLDEAALLCETITKRKALCRWSKAARLHVIAGIREPTGKALATIFQNHSAYFPDLDSISAQGCADLLLLSPDLSAERRQYMLDMRAVYQEWFDAELKAVLDIDVYASPFPHEKGYLILENDLARVLVYRFENFSAMPGMLEHFLGTPVPAMVNQNMSTEKDYAGHYRAVKAQLRLPAAFLEEQYSSKPVLHFYTREERAQFIRQWQSSA